MRRQEFEIDSSFLDKALAYAQQFEECIFLNGNNYENGFSDVLAFGSQRSINLKGEKYFSELETFIKTSRHTCYGFFSYDLKNEVEKLTSKHEDKIKFPLLFFFEPLHEITFEENRISINSENPSALFSEIEKHRLSQNIEKQHLTFDSTTSQEKYLDTVRKIKNHIKDGDTYELNYCVEFHKENVEINPIEVYKELNKLSPTPFSTFVRKNDSFLISASPERFIKRVKNKVISEPIKGTVRRGNSTEEDEKLKQDLRSSEKEQAENLMIVDLVRNDLAKTAIKGSIKVDNLFKIHTFPQVHQMISTISSEVDPKNTNSVEVIKNAFPMGSMTGAPKVKAMELIEKYENAYRGLFSGAVGFINPKTEEFDFNVIIRSFLYNQKSKYLSFQVGSAITYDSDENSEYEECLLKAKALRKCFSKK